MCTIAGYNGTKRAAPILIDMMRKLEGLDSGFYTGIATVCDGKIYSAKVLGDLDTLLETTDAASLPGNMGFIHSRTRGGDFECDFPEWAHPFTTEKDGDIKLAMIMNGCAGIFRRTFNGGEIAQRLMDRGYTVKSHHPDHGNTRMADDTHVQSTDVRCQLAASKIDSGMAADYALQQTFTEMPGEAVALMLSVTEPEAICFARLVMPMHLSFCSHGAYMATAPLAFPKDGGDYIAIPSMTYGKVYRGSYEAQPFVSPPATVAPITPQVMALAYNYLEQKLKTPTPFAETGLSEFLEGYYPKADCTQRGTVGYRVISEFARQGRLNVETRYVAGKIPQLRAPIFYLSLKDE